MAVLEEPFFTIQTEQNNSIFEIDDENENCKNKGTYFVVTTDHKHKNISIEDDKSIERTNDHLQIIISDEFSKENDPIKSVKNIRKNRKFVTKKSTYNNLNSLNDSELKSIAQQTNENEIEDKDSNCNFLLFLKNLLFKCLLIKIF